LFDEENNADSITRDQIRKEVLAAFSSVRVWLFDSPCDSVKKLKNKLTIDMTTPEFRSQVRDLRHVLAGQLKEPMFFAGQPFTGDSMGPLIALVASALNKGEAVLPQSTYTAMLRSPNFPILIENDFCG